DSGHVSGIAGIARNITQRKKAEIELQKVVQMLQAIRVVNRIITQERNAGKLLEDTCRSLTSIRGYMSCWIVHFDDKSNLLWSAHSNTDDNFIRYLSSVQKGILPNCVQQSLTSVDSFLVKPNDTLCSDCPTPAVISEGLQVLIVPIKCAGENRGVFSAMIRNTDALDAGEMDLLQELMDDVGLALHNIQLEELRAKTELALKQSEERFRLISETAEDIIYRINLRPEFRLDYVSPSIFKILGYNQKTVASFGRWLAGLIHPADFPMIKILLRNPAQTGSTPFVMRWKHANGKWVQVEHRHALFPGENGQAEAVVGIGRDISERIRMEDSLKTSQAFSQKLLEEAPNPVLVYNQDSSVRYANPALYSLTGFSPEEVIGCRSPFPWWPADRKEEYLSLLEWTQRTGKAIQEHLFQKKNGEAFWVINSIRVIHLNHQVEYALANWIDITERKKAELAVRQSEEKTRLVFASIADGIIISDLQGKIQDCNDRALMLAGIAKDQMIGMNIVDFIHPEDQLRAFENIQSTIFYGNMGHIQYNLVRPDGVIIPADTIASVAKDANGAPLYLIVSFQDITGRLKMEKRILDLYEAEKKQREELQEEARMRGMFVDVLAHELRTPLTPILASGGMLRDLLEETQNTLLKKLIVNITNGADTLSRRLEDLLDVARYSRGVFQLNYSPVDLKPFFENAVERFKPALDQRRQELVGTIADNLPVAEVDSSRLEQVVVNLLANASKFSYDECKIHFKAVYQEGSLTFEVQDEGIGISREEIIRLFQPYHRVEQDRQKFPGIGLGLAVSKQIVNAHGGTINVRSQPGQGSVFTVTIPLKVLKT
ncbi:MAG TPA: PAS domain S-box protein, partial [Dehalococcoidales bacterium]|nr:PAS domain S-box protein [Dehalococcoidales bacterium]